MKGDYIFRRKDFAYIILYMCHARFMRCPTRISAGVLLILPVLQIGPDRISAHAERLGGLLLRCAARCVLHGRVCCAIFLRLLIALSSRPLYISIKVSLSKCLRIESIQRAVINVQPVICWCEKVESLRCYLCGAQEIRLTRVTTLSCLMNILIRFFNVQPYENYRFEQTLPNQSAHSQSQSNSFAYWALMSLFVMLGNTQNLLTINFA